MRAKKLTKILIIIILLSDILVQNMTLLILRKQGKLFFFVFLIMLLYIEKKTIDVEQDFYHSKIILINCKYYKSILGFFWQKKKKIEQNKITIKLEIWRNYF